MIWNKEDVKMFIWAYVYMFFVASLPFAFLKLIGLDISWGAVFLGGFLLGTVSLTLLIIIYSITPS